MPTTQRGELHCFCTVGYSAAVELNVSRVKVQLNLTDVMWNRDGEDDTKDYVLYDSTHIVLRQGK